MDDINDYDCDLKALDAMNNLGLWMKWRTWGRVLKALDVMNNSWLWMTWMTLGRELRDLNVMNNWVL